ncbi:hypothetical protein SGFS_062050 [Streptomyces graminofaciens]|uniref:Uncharacterized protein n=1 Tax=Streptomyces graminofaciens TaxID=68212 RepID=A0ABM7FEI8_9ACTN|nr:hypothetical protein SGFS_062050 [Streptomyces graminofaciens]
MMLLIPALCRALALSPFEMSPHGRNAGVTLGGGARGVNDMTRDRGDVTGGVAVSSYEVTDTPR